MPGFVYGWDPYLRPGVPSLGGGSRLLVQELRVVCGGIWTWEPSSPGLTAIRSFRGSRLNGLALDIWLPPLLALELAQCYVSAEDGPEG